MLNVIALCVFRGQKFIEDHLRMEDVSCYWETLLTEYSKLIEYKPKRKSSYDQITRKPDRSELWPAEAHDFSSVQKMSFSLVLLDFGTCFKNKSGT